MKQSNRYYKNGFTLIELLVVLAILGALAGLVGPKVMKHLSESKSKTAKIQIEELAGALDMYKLDTGRYPSTSQGLSALVEKPGDVRIWNGPYLRKNKLPQDPWNRDFKYESPGTHGSFDLFTYGLDERQGGEGENKDIASWE